MPAEAMTANTQTTSVATEVAATVPAIGVVSAAEAAASIWLPVTVVVGDMDRESAGVVAGLAAHGIKVSRRNVQAVTATVGTDEENGKALTVIPVGSA